MNRITPLFTAFVLFAFITSSVGIVPVKAAEFVLPAPGTMVALSAEYSPAIIKGVTIHPENALEFDFIMDQGEESFSAIQKKDQYTKLIKYFLAALTVADKDQWVNLSPYESGRIIESNFGKTEMGRDLLAQDYLLKQITSSMMYPESGLGKNFWDKVYEKAYKELGNTNIPVNTINKVWIMPDEALVYEKDNTALILKSRLKVMLEEDYLATKVIASGAKQSKIATMPKASRDDTSAVIREIILPELEKEVNEGKNFAQLRQIYSAMVLATWYKQTLKESILGKVYADKAKVGGVDQDPKNNDLIYKQYLDAFKKGVYNYIKEDQDKYSQQIIPRKYFAGGFDRAMGAAVRVFRSDYSVNNRDNPVNLSAQDIARFKSEKEHLEQVNAQMFAARAKALEQQAKGQRYIREVTPENQQDFDAQDTMPQGLDGLKVVEDAPIIAPQLVEGKYFNTATLLDNVLTRNVMSLKLVEYFYSGQATDDATIHGWLDLNDIGTIHYEARGTRALVSGSRVPIVMDITRNNNIQVSLRNVSDFKGVNFSNEAKDAIAHYAKDKNLNELINQINAQLKHFMPQLEKMNDELAWDKRFKLNMADAIGFGIQAIESAKLPKVADRQNWFRRLAKGIFNAIRGFVPKEKVVVSRKKIETAESGFAESSLASNILDETPSEIASMWQSIEQAHLENGQQGRMPIATQNMGLNENETVNWVKGLLEARAKSVLADAYINGINMFTFENQGQLETKQIAFKITKKGKLENGVVTFKTEMTPLGAVSVAEQNFFDRINQKLQDMVKLTPLKAEAKNNAHILSLNATRQPIVITIPGTNRRVELQASFDRNGFRLDAMSPINGGIRKQVLSSTLSIRTIESESNVGLNKSIVNDLLEELEDMGIGRISQDEFLLDPKSGYNAVSIALEQIYTEQAASDLEHVKSLGLWDPDTVKNIEAGHKQDLEIMRAIGTQILSMLKHRERFDLRGDNNINAIVDVDMFMEGNSLRIVASGPQVNIQIVNVGTPTGGIDFNTANFDLNIKRDGKGIALPLMQQDLDALNRIEGFVPNIIEIKPLLNLPILSALEEKVKSLPRT